MFNGESFLQMVPALTQSSAENRTNRTMQSTEVYFIPTHSSWIKLTWSELFKKLGHTQSILKVYSTSFQMVPWRHIEDWGSSFRLIHQDFLWVAIRMPGGPEMSRVDAVGPWQTYRGARLPFQGRTPPAWHIPAINFEWQVSGSPSIRGSESQI